MLKRSSLAVVLLALFPACSEDARDGAVPPVGDTVVTTVTDDGSPPSPTRAALSRGDLVITELVANATGGDAGLEWFELHNPTQRAVTLDGLVIRDDQDQGHEIPAVGVEIAPGGRIVMAQSVAAVGAEIPVYVYGEAVKLRNGAGGVWLEYDGVIVEELAYDTARGWPVKEGWALALATDRIDPVANDLRSSWCVTRTSSPGRANDCTAAAVPVAPSAGDLVINEIMASPAEGGTEWVELHNRTDRVLSLFGVELEDAGGAIGQLASGAMIVEAQGFAVIASDASSAGFPAGAAVYDVGKALRLGQQDEVALRLDDEVIDRVAWNAPDGWPMTRGRSMALAPGVVDAGAPSAWCAAGPVQGDLGAILGSPGASNPDCDAAGLVPPVAGDFVITEIMVDVEGQDEGAEWVEVTNTSDHARLLDGVTIETGVAERHAFSGTGVVVPAGGRVVLAQDDKIGEWLPPQALFAEYGKACAIANEGDVVALTVGSVSIGSLSITGAYPLRKGHALSLDPDRSVAAHGDPTSWCAASVVTTLFGDRAWGTPGLANPRCAIDTAAVAEPGDLVFTELFANPKGNDAGDEWVELHNTRDHAVRLSGLAIGDGLGHHVVDLPGLEIPSHGYAVLAQRDVEVAPGVFPLYAYGEGVALDNDEGRVWIGHPAGTPSGSPTLVDSVAWNSAGGWSVPRGEALMLAPGAEDTDGNDVAAAWCKAETHEGKVYSRDLSTPGGANVACPLTTDALFDGAVMRTMAINIAPSDLAFMRENLEDKRVVPATITVDGTEARFADIRFKGDGTLAHCMKDDLSYDPSCRKAPYKVIFNETDRDYRFAGLRRVALNSNVFDETYIHDVTAYALYRAAGIPASRATSIRVELNGDLLGVYTMVESIDKEWLQDRFEDADGNLYKEVWPTYNDPESYAAALRTNEETADVSRMSAFGRAIARVPVDGVAALSPWIDVDQLGRFLAVDRVLDNTDGPLSFYCDPDADDGVAGCTNHNYYWYDDPTTGRFVLLPWDLDGTLWSDVSDFGESWWDASPRACEPTSICDVQDLATDECDEWGEGQTLMPYECDGLTNMQNPALLSEFLEGLRYVADRVMVSSAVPAELLARCAVMAPAVFEEAEHYGADGDAAVDAFEEGCDYVAGDALGETRDAAQALLERRGY